MHVQHLLRVSWHVAMSFSALQACQAPLLTQHNPILLWRKILLGPLHATCYTHLAVPFLNMGAGASLVLLLLLQTIFAPSDKAFAALNLTTEAVDALQGSALEKVRHGPGGVENE
jgi:hypothetical protein